MSFFKKATAMCLIGVCALTGSVFATDSNSNQNYELNDSTNQSYINTNAIERAYVADRTIRHDSYTTIINQYNLLGGVTIQSYKTNPGKVYLIVNGKNYTLYPGDSLKIRNIPNTDVVVQAKSGTGKTEKFKISLERGI